MKHKSLPSADTMAKITQVSFNSPSKNLSVYRLYESLKPHQSYIENERQKLIKKYGYPTGNGNYAVTEQTQLEKFYFEFNATLDADIPDKIENPNITEEDFKDDNCSYPIDKSMWPNAKDIASFLGFCKLLNQEDSN